MFMYMTSPIEHSNNIKVKIFLSAKKEKRKPDGINKYTAMLTV